MLCTVLKGAVSADDEATCHKYDAPFPAIQGHSLMPQVMCVLDAMFTVDSNHAKGYQSNVVQYSFLRTRQ